MALEMVFSCYGHSTCILYSRTDIFTGQIFHPSQLPEILSGINFCQCGKGRHRLYVIINIGDKVIPDLAAILYSMHKKFARISPMKSGG